MSSTEPTYPTVIPYLIVNHADEFMHFLHEVFGATERYRMMRNETLIAHAEMEIGDSVIMVADASPEFPVSVSGIFIQVQDTDLTHDKALSHGATSIMEPSDQGYGRASGVKDRWGNTWWITRM
jgi:uncharacterized glyoxalase superfamily protein PhnB